MQEKICRFKKKNFYFKSKFLFVPREMLEYNTCTVYKRTCHFCIKVTLKNSFCANQLSINVWQLLHKCMATTLCICCVCHCIFKKPFLCEQSNHGLPLTGSYAPPFDAYQYETGTNH